MLQTKITILLLIKMHRLSESCYCTDAAASRYIVKVITYQI